MISALLLLPMAFAQQAEPAQTNPMAELRQACEKSGKIDSYTFQFVNDSGSPFGGRGGFSRGGGGAGGSAGGGSGQAGADAKPEPPKPWNVTWQKGQPTLFAQGEFKAARLDEVTIYRTGEGKWQRLDMSGGFGRGGQRGERGERSERPAGMMQAFQMRSISLPHDMLSQLAAAVDEEQLTQSTKLGLKVYEGPLTAEGAAKLASNGRGFGRSGRGGGDRPQMTTTGSFALVLDAAGKVSQLKVETTISGSFRDQDFERKSKKVFKLSKQGKSKVELGEKAREMLKPKKSEGEEF